MALPCWGGRTRHGEEMGLLLAGQLALAPRPRALLEGREVGFDKALPGPSNRGAADLKRRSDLRIGQALICFQQDARARQFAGTRVATPQELL